MFGYPASCRNREMPRTLLLLAGILAILLNHAHGEEWVTLENCRLIPNEYNDGDSFHVSHQGEEYIFRLYFVDCPESEDSVPERLVEQAAHFGSTPEQMVEVGKDAAYAMQQLLKAPFDVVTRWQGARGRSKLQRYYAFIFIDGRDGPKSADLAAVMLSHGLARVHGVKAKPPTGGLKAAELHQIYLDIEAEAREAGKGGWK